ncbi:hypothetical protein CLOSTHATH_02920 [Hungatella hathewayi DSM 13479]|uniref:Uncharacterized protein n=1 Tax=Hungatella hathewayi DSM 13479 TaxID=566550 RepID=D3AH33_9FIRM|nr:hypothetical protein CLOSTHATH_02920 [Hungatella hathewayi DSM 13479]
MVMAEIQKKFCRTLHFIHQTFSLLMRCLCSIRRCLCMSSCP